MTWVDFKALRERLDFAAVLRHYGVELRVRKGAQHQGFCPLPTHPKHPGKRRSPSFSANLHKGVFRCFSCGAAGNALDFAVRMQGLDPGNPQDVRKAALALQQAFGIDTPEVSIPSKRGDRASPPRSRSRPRPDAPENEPAAQQNAGRGATRPAVVNAPLDFELKGLDASHPYLKERGFTKQTIAHFGLGYCRRGLMQGRIAIPLHDRRGRLVGYAGRLVDRDGEADADRPKYLFPPRRERDGRAYEFYKSLLLYNGFRVAAPACDLVVVEGFASVWWLWQAGFRDVVALMGASCSPRQAALILRAVRPGGRVWVFPDGDAAGRRCAEGLLARLAPYRFVHWVRLANGEQPTDLTAADVVDLLEVAADALDGEGGGYEHP